MTNLFARHQGRQTPSEQSADIATVKSGHKIHSLDSVRGLAALVVVVWHMASVVWPATIGGGSQYGHTPIDLLIYKGPWSVAFSGGFAVSLFFILSGFVLTLRYMSGGQSSLFPAAVKRYFRLMPVVFVSVMLSYFLLSLGIYRVAQAEIATIASPFLGDLYFSFSPSMVGAIAFGLIGAFTAAPGGLTYNPVLWTIYYELLGSLIVFGLATVSRGNRKRWALYLVATIVFIDTYFVGFIVGMILADLYASRADIFARIENLSWVYKAFALLAALSIGAYPTIIGSEGVGKYWNTLTLSPGDVFISRSILQIVAGGTVIILALSWPSLRKVLEHKSLLWLGKVSFSLYAIHLIFIYSAYLFILSFFMNHFRYGVSVLLASVFSLPIILILASFLYRYIERPSIGLADGVGKWAKSKS